MEFTFWNILWIVFLVFVAIFVLRFVIGFLLIGIAGLAATITIWLEERRKRRKK